jgi:hypothetical protein
MGTGLDTYGIYGLYLSTFYVNTDPASEPDLTGKVGAVKWQIMSL